MRRRGFIGAMLGVAAATALPSEIWPFRKIFLPAQPALDYYANPYWTEPIMSRWLGLGTSEFLLDPATNQFRLAKLIPTGANGNGDLTYFVAPDPAWPKETLPAGNYFTSRKKLESPRVELAENVSPYNPKQWQLIKPYPLPTIPEGNRCGIILWPESREPQVRA